MASEKIDMSDLFDKFFKVYKQTHVSVNGQQAQIECSNLWREIKGKDNVATKYEAEKLMSQWKVNVKKPGKGSIVNFFTKQSSTKKGNKSSPSSDVEVVIEVSPPPPSQQITDTANAAPPSPQQITVSTDAALKPKLTPKQDELNKKINIENEILVSLYRKRDLGQASESDRKEISTRQATLQRLKKELKETIQNAARQKKLRDERKRKLESMDVTTRKKLMGKATSDLGRSENCDVRIDQSN
ncbi:Uncharacterised protein g5038 [Pycnogonum litorale]